MYNGFIADFLVCKRYSIMVEMPPFVPFSGRGLCPDESACYYYSVKQYVVIS